MLKKQTHWMIDWLVHSCQVFLQQLGRLKGILPSGVVYMPYSSKCSPLLEVKCINL